MSSLLCSLVSVSQTEPVQPAYLRFPVFPPVKLLLPDSISFFTKKDLDKRSNVLLILFNPNCEHCQHETEEITRNIDQFREIQIVMATSMHFDSMMVFRQRFNLGNFKNITVGQDPSYFLFGFFLNRNLPFMAFYNRRKELITVFEGILPIPAILEVYKTR